jgi:hypothetical protein
VTVIPQFKGGKLHFVGGDVGPFVPAVPVDVPLWLAISLKKRGRCKIQPPEWMSAGEACGTACGGWGLCGGWRVCADGLRCAAVCNVVCIGVS